MLGRVSPAAKRSPLGAVVSCDGLAAINSATKAAVHAIKGEPKASEVAAKKDLAHHPFAAD